MTAKEARIAGRLLVTRYIAEAIKREVARAGQEASPALQRAVAQLDDAVAGKVTGPLPPY